MMKFKASMCNSKSVIESVIRMDGLKRGLHAAAIYVKGRLRQYPSQPGNVEYRRTGNLRNRWTQKGSNGGLTQTLGNNAHYADRVQGKQDNPYFRRVWGAHSIQAVASRSAPRVGRIVNNEIKRSI